MQEKIMQWAIFYKYILYVELNYLERHTLTGNLYISCLKKYYVTDKKLLLIEIHQIEHLNVLLFSQAT